MSQLEISNPIVGTPRNAAGGVRQQGIVGSLVAPGITPSTSLPNQQTLTAGMDLLRALGGAVSAAGNAVAQIRAEEAGDRKAAQAVQETADRGEASREASARFIEVQKAISDGAVTIPPDADPREYAEAFVQQETSGKSDTYRDQFSKIMVPRIMEQVAGVQEKQAQQATADALQLARDEVTASPADAAAVVARLRNIPRLAKLGDSELTAAVVLPAAEQHAMNGAAGEDAVRGLLGLLGQNYLADQNKILRQMESIKQAQLADANRAAMETIKANLDEPYERQRVIIDELFKRGDISEAQRDAEVARLDNQIAADLRDTQTANARNLIREVVQGRMDSAEAAAQVSERMDLPTDNPQHLDVNTGLQVLGLTRQRFEDNTRLNYVRAVAGGNVTTRPLGADDDKALTTVMMETGALTPQSDASGNPIYAGVANPSAAVLMIDQTKRVPTQVEYDLRQSMAGDTGQVAYALKTLGRLYKQNPVLAEGVIDGMNDTARTRARFAIDQMQVNSPDDVTDGDAFDARMEQLAQTAMRFGQLDIQPAQVKSLLWKGTPEAKVSQVEITAAAIKDIDDGIVGRYDTYLPRFLGGVDFPDVKITVANFYAQRAEREFQGQLALGATAEQAAERAKASAMNATANRFPVLTWNNSAYFTESPGFTITPEQAESITTVVRQDLRQFFKQAGEPISVPDNLAAIGDAVGFTSLVPTVGIAMAYLGAGRQFGRSPAMRNLSEDEAVQYLSERYHPQYDKGQGGYVLVNNLNPQDRLTLGGRIFLSDPFTPAAVADHNNAINRMELEARMKHDQMRRQMEMTMDRIGGLRLPNRATTPDETPQPRTGVNDVRRIVDRFKQTFGKPKEQQ